MSCNCNGQYPYQSQGYQDDYRQQPGQYGHPQGHCRWPSRWVRECRWVCRPPHGPGHGHHGPGGIPRPEEVFYTDEDYYY